MLAGKYRFVICVSSRFGSSIGTISPLESKLAMFQCKEVKKILELTLNLWCFSKTKHLTLRHRNTQNGWKSTQHKSQTTTFCFLRGSLRCKGEKAKNVPLLQKHKNTKSKDVFCIASLVLSTNSCKSIDHSNATWILKPHDLILN